MKFPRVLEVRTGAFFNYCKDDEQHLYCQEGEAGQSFNVTRPRFPCTAWCEDDWGIPARKVHDEAELTQYAEDLLASGEAYCKR